MGVVNVTPDSFSDGGLYLDHGAAIAHGLALERAGASILDVGGESTRPGANPVAEAEELRRVIPVIEGLLAAGCRAQLSVDTSKAAVAEAALASGATLVNDVTALRGDAEMAGVIAGADADCCLMHMLGEPRTMQRDPRYGDVVSEIAAFLEQRLEVAGAAGIARGADPAGPRDRVRQDRGAQPRAAAPPGRDRRTRAARWRSAPRASHSWARSPPARWRIGSRRRWPPTCSPTSAVPACFGCTTSLRSMTRWRSRLLRWAPHGRAADDEYDDADDVEGRRRGLRARGHDRGQWPVAVHACRGDRGRARGRPAAADRHADRRRGVRRHDHRSDRGHNRLRPGLRDGQPGREQRTYKTLERLCAAIAERILDQYDAGAVWVKAAKPEPPLRCPWARSRWRCGARPG